MMVDISSIRPGLSADIVINVDFSDETIDVRGSIIYDVLETRIILSETNPPITNRYIGNKVAVTYLVKEKEGQVRYGFYGRIVEIIRDYELASSESVAAFVVERESEPIGFNVRMFYRVEPTGDSGVSLSVKGEKMNVLDISIGGAKVTHLGTHPFEYGKRVKGNLSLDGEDFDIEARILRVWQPHGNRKLTDLEFVTMQFLGMDKRMEGVLSRKIREIEREMRFREMFP